MRQIIAMFKKDLTLICIWLVGLLPAFKADAAETASPATQPMAIRYTWVAADGRPFNHAEIKRISSQYSWIIIEKNHAGYDFKQQDEDARRLKAANPDVR